MRKCTGRFKQQLRLQGDVTRAVYEAGFGSSSGAYEQVSSKLGMTPRQYLKGGEDVAISFAIGKTALGWILVALSAPGVCAIELGNDASELRVRLFAAFPRAKIRQDNDGLAPYLEVVLRYLA